MSLPKFLAATDIQMTRDFIVHTEVPRFVAEVFARPTGGPLIEPEWIDPVDEVDIEDIKDLMRQAGEFHIQSLQEPGQQN
jgi:hypothetical protein